MRYVAIDDDNGFELMLKTADRRDWRVHVDLVTLSRLADRRITSEDEARGVINRHMALLKLAAFRVISRGLTGNVVRLRATDLRLPPEAVAA
jgi:hypothetical protein